MLEAAAVKRLSEGLLAELEGLTREVTRLRDDASAPTQGGQSATMGGLLGHHLRRTSETALAILADFVDLSRMESGEDPLDISAFDLVEMLRKLEPGIRAKADAAGCTVRFAYSGDFDLVLGDPRKIERIIDLVLKRRLLAGMGGAVSISLERVGEGDEGEPSLRLGLTRIGALDDDAQAESPEAFAMAERLLTAMGGEFGTWAEAETGAAAWIVLPAEGPEKAGAGDVGSSLVDVSVLETLARETSPEIVPDLLLTFREDLIDRAVRIQAALEATDLDVLEHETHTLSSSSITFGAAALSKLAKQAELSLKSGDSEKGLAMVRDLLAIVTETDQALAAYRP